MHEEQPARAEPVEEDRVTSAQEMWPYDSVFPMEHGWRSADFTKAEVDRLTYVFDAAMCEAGYPSNPERDPHFEKNYLLTCHGVPADVIERARAIALAAIGRSAVPA